MRTPLLLGLFLFVVSCYYEPEGEFTANPVPIPLDGIVIDLKEISDTLFVHDYVQVTYSASNIQPPLRWITVNVYIDENLIYTGQENGFFSIDPYRQGSGVYRCKVEYVAPSGSGSLAEKAGKEFVSASRDFVVVVDVDFPQPAVITSIDDTSGKLVIHWTRCEKKNFASYVVVKECFEESWNYRQCGSIEITDVNTTSWTDENFVAGSAKYRIITNANLRTSYGPEARYDFFPQTDFDVVDKRVTLGWDKPKLFANTKAVTLKDYSVDSFESTTMIDTLFETPSLPDFGDVSRNIEVTFHSQNEENSYSFVVPYYLGEFHQAPAVRPAYYSPASGHYYGFLPDGLNALDEFYNLLVDDYNLDPANVIAISQDGEFIVGHKSFDPQRPLQQLDLESVNPVGSLSLTAIFGSENYASIIYSYERFSSSLSVGNNGCVALSTMGGTRIYKLPAFDEVFAGSQTYGPFFISASGNYAYRDGEILSFNGSVFEKTGDVQVTPVNVLSDKHDNLILTFAGKITILNPANNSAVAQIDIPFDNFYSVRYDPHSNLLLCGQDRSYCLVDLASGEKRMFNAGYNLNIVRGKLFIPYDHYYYQFYSIDPQFYFQP